MSMVDVAQAAVVRRGFSPRWGKTTTTTIEDEQPDISTASEEAPQHAVWGHLFVARLAQRMESPVPPRIGKILLIEAAPEEVGLFEDTVGSSGIVSDFFNVLAWSYVAVVPHRRPPVESSAFYADELLDWDFAVETAPKRPTGTLTVTLKYVPRGNSAPFEDPGD
jgi:hypothetical protein